MPIYVLHNVCPFISYIFHHNAVKKVVFYHILKINRLRIVCS